MVRIDRGTRAALERVRVSLITAEEMGLVALDHDDRDRVSLSQVIDRLIAFRDRHASRRWEASARRKQRRKEGNRGS
jgi:hypothetical protein